MFLHEQSVWARRMHRNPVHAMADFRVWIRHELRVQTAVDRFPGFAGVVRPKSARRGNRDEHSLRIFWIDQDAVQAHTARAGLPLRPGVMLSKTGKFVPRFAAIF